MKIPLQPFHQADYQDLGFLETQIPAEISVERQTRPDHRRKEQRWGGNRKREKTWSEENKVCWTMSFTIW
ncbi:hypothetical protein TNCV_4613971 [Trichonephila clavipes]|nr:hypothetical protein TNCV_4613971 [Trichonephila clavipes]